MTAGPSPASFDLAPPLPARPIQWGRAAQLLRTLLRDPDATDQVFEFFEAIGGRGNEQTVRDFVGRPEGRRLLVEKPSLLGALSDREALCSLPPGSFGRAYFTFAERNGFAADGLVQANDRGFGESNAQLDADRRWFFERVTLMHELWHVLTGYDTDGAGEVALLGFSMSQGLAGRAIRFLYLTALATSPKSDRFAFQRFVRHARQRGREAAPLFIQPYEELLAQPLADVRRKLRILPIHEAHADGIFRSNDGLRGVTRVAA